ncbi:MAG TPA: uroporphyrinogen decarboxylase family protein [Chitinophagales bacterium]|nr:uroporphyrinogen decarboxylase family protein [Chitinophagales bacterium]
MLRAFGKSSYICNLGHGVYPDVDFEKAKYFIDVVKEFKE